MYSLNVIVVLVFATDVHIVPYLYILWACDQYVTWSNYFDWFHDTFKYSSTSQ